MKREERRPDLHLLFPGGPQPQPQCFLMPLIPIIPPNGPELWSPQSPTIVDQIQDKVWDKGSLFLAKVGPRQTRGGAGPRLPFEALRFQRWSPVCSLTPLSCRQKPSGMLLSNGLTSWPSPSPSPRVSFPYFPSIPNESGYFQPLSLSIPAPQSLVLKQGAGRGGWTKEQAKEEDWSRGQGPALSCVLALSIWNPRLTSAHLSSAWE